MADVRNLVALHFVWATYDRLPKLTPEVADVSYQCVRSVCEEMRCPVIAVGGVEDHIHVLVHFATTVTIAKLAQEMKGYSARIVNERFPGAFFKWQGGYGVFPVPPNAKARVEAYILDQEEHHGRGSLIAALENTGFTRSEGTAAD
jgi:Transposase and inactivated derivatives